MSTFSNNDLTTAGIALMAKGLAGTPIVYTKIVLGDNYLGAGQTPRNLPAVIHPVVTVGISKCSVLGNGTVAIGGVFSNADLDAGFYFRELGLYATDPDVGEILYSYGNAGDLAEYISPAGGSSILEKSIDVLTVVGAAANVTANIASGVYATQEQLQQVQEIALQAKTDSISAEEIAEAAQNSVTLLGNTVSSNTNLIQVLWNAVFSSITGNPFTVLFDDLDGITLTSGIWNNNLQRLEC